MGNNIVQHPDWPPRNRRPRFWNVQFPFSHRVTNWFERQSTIRRSFPGFTRRRDDRSTNNLRDNDSPTNIWEDNDRPTNTRANNDSHTDRRESNESNDSQTDRRESNDSTTNSGEDNDRPTSNRGSSDSQDNDSSINSSEDNDHPTNTRANSDSPTHHQEDSDSPADCRVDNGSSTKSGAVNDRSTNDQVDNDSPTSRSVELPSSSMINNDRPTDCMADNYSPINNRADNICPTDSRTDNDGLTNSQAPSDQPTNNPADDDRSTTRQPDNSSHSSNRAFLSHRYRRGIYRRNFFSRPDEGPRRYSPFLNQQQFPQYDNMGLYRYPQAEQRTPMDFHQMEQWWYYQNRPDRDLQLMQQGLSNQDRPEVVPPAVGEAVNELRAYALTQAISNNERHMRGLGAQMTNPQVNNFGQNQMAFHQMQQWWYYQNRPDRDLQLMQQGLSNQGRPDVGPPAMGDVLNELRAYAPAQAISINERDMRGIGAQMTNPQVSNFGHIQMLPPAVRASMNQQYTHAISNNERDTRGLGAQMINPQVVNFGQSQVLPLAVRAAMNQQYTHVPVFLYPQQNFGYIGGPVQPTERNYPLPPYPNRNNRGDSQGRRVRGVARRNNGPPPLIPITAEDLIRLRGRHRVLRVNFHNH